MLTNDENPGPLRELRLSARGPHRRHERQRRASAHPVQGRPEGPCDHLTPVRHLDGGSGPQLPTANFRRPVKRGDLPTWSQGTVVIIDGDFHQSLSLSPKETVRLLDEGTRVIGASSMGALRAAELAPYGIRGCGWVFQAYRPGRIIADDEVAVTYSPEDLTCLTVPLVNVRRWLDCLEMRSLVDPPTSRRLLAKADCSTRTGPRPV